MTLDFSNTAQINSITETHLTDSSTADWLKDVFLFISWYLNETGNLIQHTSGSTGTPKAIQLSRPVLEASALATNDFFKLDQQTQALLCIPAKYIGGKMMILRAILGRWKLILTEPKLKLDLTAVSGAVDFTAMIPAQVQKVLNSEIVLRQKCKTIIIGGAPVSTELETAIIKNHSRCFSTYGMTETASHVALKHIGAGSDFIALNGITFSTDSDSRLVINGTRVPNAPLLTNDLVELTSPKAFKWLGRFDFIINSGGVKIIAEELEKRIATLLKKPFYIKKETHRSLGETPVLVVNDTEWPALKQYDFLAELKRKTPEFWLPTQIKFLENFEYSESGKLLRT